MRKVGVLVLDETVGNIFNEVEQIAFSPSAFVPGGPHPGPAQCC